MARICGVNLPKEKRIEIALTYIHGIGRSLSNEILEELNINKNIKVHELSETDVTKLRDRIDKIATEGDLRRKVSLDIKRLQDAGSYRGYRHKRRLPARGQRTKTNARTKRGKRVTMGSGKIKEQKK
ncbi:30S ribosomal protein S13 [Candidatus Peregrinibacteria bacterium CG22_combo_CG10-13_8_21_14_all_44_10]|nr:MAG: 30S ribosomal protein S13 [Candidatus Peregrinibacteria bacterium CG2_30_44_17]PIP66074.1 MAG: 30S ribosomal protein S13 [Candidatus Peregrinibacteria bacterium CG22_combo_CG10-13_8_21_14_all_44_10]PIS03610.1 MAG: 30S ribosomal protein S13 [Candidatus Peregrinibacteria bacterium CG10_big_fil_rev_8_21_14_0_10_44_7]PIX78872.1 MAG: 30S ribosomal protein S13 [Candidatus Peregrinibacteria bacterium CG_4_10_14_3_um_filter_44_21]PJB88877.1 MAG: 30S ribosomal protein S13 [Candidatus Peregriniba